MEGNSSSCDVPQHETGISEILLTLAAFGILLGYFIFFMTHREQSVFGLGSRNRKKWVDRMMSKDKNSILIVQTMRNELMVASFLGETSFNAVTVIISISTALDLTCTLKKLESYDPILASAGTLFSPTLKVGLVCCILAATFGMSLQAVRFTKHISVMGAGFSQPTCDPFASQMKAAILQMYNQLSIFLFIAQRLVYITFAAIAWLFGPTLFLLTTLALVVHMASVDTSQAMDAQRMAQLKTPRQNANAGSALLEHDVVALASRAHEVEEGRGTNPESRAAAGRASAGRGEP